MQASEVIVKYLEDAEAAERTFEDALSTFSKSGDQDEVRSMMSGMSIKARTQHERLAARLKDYGANPSTLKSWLAHALAFTPTSAQAGHTAGEKSTQHLMITYAAAAAEMAMYESLASVAETLGDQQTTTLARELQQEEKQDHEMAWRELGRSASDSFRRATTAPS